jgi:hypothetical protein
VRDIRIEYVHHSHLVLSGTRYAESAPNDDCVYLVGYVNAVGSFDEPPRPISELNRGTSLGQNLVIQFAGQPAHTHTPAFWKKLHSTVDDGTKKWGRRDFIYWCLCIELARMK